MLFSIIGAFIDRVAENSDIPKLTSVHIIYSESASYFMFKLHSVIGSWMPSDNLMENIQKLKAIAEQIFGNLKGINLFNLKFQMLDYVAKDKKIFGLLDYLDVSLDEHFDFDIKQLQE